MQIGKKITTITQPRRKKKKIRGIPVPNWPTRKKVKKKAVLRLE